MKVKVCIFQFFFKLMYILVKSRNITYSMTRRQHKNNSTIIMVEKNVITIVQLSRSWCRWLYKLELFSFLFSSSFSCTFWLLVICVILCRSLGNLIIISYIRCLCNIEYCWVSTWACSNSMWIKNLKTAQIFKVSFFLFSECGGSLGRVWVCLFVTLFVFGWFFFFVCVCGEDGG